MAGFDKQVPTTFAQSLYAISSTPLHPLGTRRALGDGRVFHYCKAGDTELAAGKLVVPVVIITERDDALHAAAIAAVGTKEITFTTVGAIVANAFAEGFLAIINDDGQGCQYKIKSHAATTGSADITIYLYDAIRVATSATTDAMLLKSMFSDLILAPDGANFAVGVPTMTVTLNYYFWCQTWGPALVLCGDST